MLRKRHKISDAVFEIEFKRKNVESFEKAFSKASRKCLG